MKLYNTATRKLEEFTPLKMGDIGIYSCGPTVYWNQHIGHMFAYSKWDVLVRFLRYLGHKVRWVMNITDVGHMTSDADTGEDKMEKGAKREGINVWQIADKYIVQFKESLKLLNITPPDVLCRATEHVNEQIELIKLIERNGFTYKTKTGLVFDTAKFPNYADFARLDLSKQEAGARLEVDPEKKNPWDFLLWVTNQPKHIMQWDSPWGRGFPGWHIECTAMSVKYLGESFDIHTGGVDHISVHHTNEIAQGFAAFGHRTARYWLHNGMLMFRGEKVSKSSGNIVTAQELVEKGHDPLAMRYLTFNSHYRTGMEFTFESLEGAAVALRKLWTLMGQWRGDQSRTVLSPEKMRKIEELRKKFADALANDLNTADALSVVWETAKSSIPSEDKYDLLIDFDQVLGLDLRRVPLEEKVPRVPQEVKDMIEKREQLRREGKWGEADKIRDKMLKMGWEVRDTAGEPVVKKR